MPLLCLLLLSFNQNKIKSMKNICTFIALLCAPILMAQNLNISKQKRMGGIDDDVIYQSLQALNGYVYAVGETFSQTKGGSDGYFIMLNPFSQEVTEWRLGGEKDDVLKSIAALPNGNFVLAGSTKSKGYGKSDGWVVYVDDKGKVLSEKTYGTTGDDAFDVVVVTTEGSVMLAGYQNGHKQSPLWLVKDVGGKTIVDKQFLTEQYIENIKSGVADTEGGLVLVGNTKKGNNIWVLKINKLGNTTNVEKQYGENNTYEEAAQIIATSDGGYAVVGRTENTRGKKLNAWLLKLDVSGTIQWEENYGGSDFDFATSVVQTANDQYVLIGSSLSETSDARTRQVYIVRTDMRGREMRTYFEGGKQDDDGSYVNVLYDGSLGVFSSTVSTLKGKTKDVVFYTFKISENDDTESASSSEKSFATNENTLEWRNWKINDKDYLETNQQTFLSVDFTNTTSNLINNVQLQLKSPVSDLVLPSISYLGAVKRNETRRIYIPIRSLGGLDEGQYFVEARLMVNNALFSRFTKPINVKKGGQTVIINPSEYTATDTAITFILVNSTTQVTKTLRLNFELPRELTAKNLSVFNIIDPIPAGKTRKMTLLLKPNTEGGIKTKVVGQLFEDNVLRDKMSFDIQSKKSSNRGAQLAWHSPDEHGGANLQNLVTDKAEFRIELNVDTYEPVKKDDFRIFIDDVPLEGSRMDVTNLSAAIPEDDILRMRYSAKVPFTTAKTYQIRVELTTSKETVQSKTLIIRYNTEKPNLHILSIGTSHKDLKYTTKDARDFAATLATQARDLFKNIYPTTLTDSALTTQRSIQRAFGSLKNRFENDNIENRIFSNDYLIVFISSHGKTSDDKRFKLLPSDYNTIDGDYSTIDYQNDALAALEKVKCHKLILIDACHSGAAKGAKAGADAEALQKLSRAAIGTATISSCQSDELSYEDPDWQNGAFTEALIESFTNKKCTDQSGVFSSDTNNDRKITINEVFNFIKRRVPHLVKNQKISRVTEQNPNLNGSDLDMTIPIVTY